MRRRQQRLADVVAREALAFEDDDLESGVGEQGGGNRPRRTSPHDHDVGRRDGSIHRARFSDRVRALSNRSPRTAARSNVRPRLLADTIAAMTGHEGAGAREDSQVGRNHGLIVAGRSLRRAADMVEIIDRSAEVIIGCHALGRPPSVLPAEVVSMLQRMGDLLA